MKNPNIAAPIAMYNTLNLMDQTAIKISQAKNNLAEARKELASKKLLQEYYVSKADPRFKIEAPWTENKPLDAYLTGLSKTKGSEVIAFPNGINPHGFEIDTVDSDRLWIYNNNEIWSTGLVKTFGYVYKGGNILTIYNEPNAHKYLEVDGKGDGFECGSLTYKNGNWKFVVTAEDAEPGYGDVEQEASLLDNIQTVLDVVGFVPVYGDFVDAVNAVIYFIRGKWFDGILSMLAIIPLIGSALKVSIKSLYKGVQLKKLTRIIETAWKGKDSTAIFKELINSGAIRPENFYLLGKGLDSLNSMIKSGNAFTKKIPGIKNADEVLAQLDDLEVFMKNANIDVLAKTADDGASVGAAVIRGGKRGAAGQIGSGVNAIADAEKILAKTSHSIAKTLTLNILPLFKSFGTLNPKALKNLNRALDQRFVRELADPNKLAALMKTTTNKTTFLRLQSHLNSVGRVPRPGGSGTVPFITGLEKASELATKLKSLSKNDIDKLARDMGSVITSNPGTHVMHNAYKNDTLVNLKAYTSLDMKDPTSAWRKQFNFEYKKNIDIIWNEIHDVGEDVGIESRPGVDSFENKVDEADGIVWPLVKKMLATVMGQKNYDSTKEIANNFKDSPLVAAAVDQLSDKSRIAYDVEKAKGGDY
jgi:hypothetical protein